MPLFGSWTRGSPERPTRQQGTYPQQPIRVTKTPQGKAARCDEQTAAPAYYYTYSIRRPGSSTAYQAKLAHCTKQLTHLAPLSLLSGQTTFSQPLGNLRAVPRPSNWAIDTSTASWHPNLVSVVSPNLRSFSLSLGTKLPHCLPEPCSPFCISHSEETPKTA